MKAKKVSKTNVEKLRLYLAKQNESNPKSGNSPNKNTKPKP